MGSRWSESPARRSADDYDASWVDMARSGQDPHGEAGLVASWQPARVLDAGCGTGRVAVELHRRGIAVVGVDADDAMLAGARRKSADVEWIGADLADVDIRDAAGERRRFDVVVLAGNVMIFLAPGSESAVVANLAGHMAPGARLVAGFQLDSQLDLATYDEVCAAAGLVAGHRWSTWDRQPFVGGGRYAVSVHRLPS